MTRLDAAFAPGHARPISSEEVWWPGIDDQHGEAIDQLQRLNRDTDAAADMEYEDLRGEPQPGDQGNEVQPGDQGEDVQVEADDQGMESAAPEQPAAEAPPAGAPDLEYGLPPIEEELQATRPQPASSSSAPSAQPVPQPEPNYGRWGREEFQRRRQVYDHLDDVPHDSRAARAKAEAARRPDGPYYTTADDHEEESHPPNSTFVNILRGVRAQSDRLRRKLQDKEIAWKDIPENQKDSYIKAIAEHWEEWKKFGSVEVMSPEASAKAREMYDKSRFLPSRFVFRDKNASIRTEANPVPVKAKARLCAGGHRDPDLQTGALRTDAPTVTRTSSLLFFIMTARHGWEPICADIMSAFMQGEEQPREKELFMEQPAQGLPGLVPGQVLRVAKGEASASSNARRGKSAEMGLGPH